MKYAVVQISKEVGRIMEEIIIDNINLSECEYFKRNRGFNCYKGINCNEVQDCYYKQLKRKEKECEELNKKVELLLGQLITLDEEDVTIQVSQEQFNEYNKLKQALQEIKEYIDINRDKWCLEHCNRTNVFCEKRNCYPIRDLTNILQKISEVEE